MSEIEKANSVLRLKNLFFDHIIFERNVKPKSDKKPFNISVEYSDKNDNLKQVNLSCLIYKEQYKIEISLIGVFEISDDVDFKEILFRNNTVAIMFPYLRSEISLLTAQPGMAPIVIPPLNINNLLFKEET